MNLKYLEYSLKIAESRSINKAASELLLSQSYLSSCLKSLEIEIGFPIFIRKNIGVVPTQTGKEFLMIANDIVHKMEQIKRLSETCGERALNIASEPLSHIMKLFLDFKADSVQKRSDTLIEYFDPKTLFETVSTGKHQMGIFLLTTDITKERLASIKKQHGLQIQELLPANPCYAVISKSHPLYEKETISLADLRAYPLISYPVSDTAYFKNYVHKLGLPHTAEDLLTISNRGQFFDALSSGHYFALVSYWNFPANTDLRYIPLTNAEFGFTLNYTYREDYKLGMLETHFIKYIQKHLS